MIPLAFILKPIKIPFMSDRTRTLFAVAGMIIILLALFLIFRLDHKRHERELNQHLQEQEAVREGHAAQITIP